MKAQNNIEEDIIICEALGIEKTDLIKNPNARMSECPKLKEFKQRISNGEPLAYISGHQPFMGSDFLVNRAVLIPRPETELLVEEAAKISWAESILDIGAGSGCIAVSLAKLLPRAKITATDISREALDVSRRNAETHGVSKKITFLQGNLFEPVKGRKFDVIVSNPPYIPSSGIENLQPEVRDFEPKAALDGGPDGLNIIREIIAKSRDFLNENGFLFFEFGAGQAEEIISVLKENGYTGLEIINDYSNIERIAKVRA